MIDNISDFFYYVFEYEHEPLQRACLLLIICSLFMQQFERASRSHFFAVNIIWEKLDLKT